MNQPTIATLWIVAVACSLANAWAAEPMIGFEDRPDRLVITQDSRPLAEYMKSGDRRTSRPFFRSLHAPGGQQVSINNPPGPGEPDDHGGYHVGLYMAYGRLGDYDTWRLQDGVQFVEYVSPPAGTRGRGTFAVKSRYVANAGAKSEQPAGEVFANEVSHFTFLTRPHGTLLVWESTFSSDIGEIIFGDQEEMGLSIRVNAPMNVEENPTNRATKKGRMLNARGDVNEDAVRARNEQEPVEWCDYSGWVDGEFAGVLMMGNPRNHSLPYWHARDYGVLVNNPFASGDLGKGKPNKIVVKRGDQFTIRFGVLLHGGDKDPKDFDPAAAYRDYLSVANDP